MLVKPKAIITIVVFTAFALTAASTVAVPLIDRPLPGDVPLPPQPKKTQHKHKKYNRAQPAPRHNKHHENKPVKPKHKKRSARPTQDP